MLHLPVVAVPFALCAAVAAQTVHTVGPGGFAQVQAAITAAANGDVILVQPGTYGPFTLDKDLTITTPPGDRMATRTSATAGSRWASH